MEMNYSEYDAYHHRTTGVFELKGSPAELIAFVKGLDNSELIQKKLVKVLDQAKVSFKDELDKALQGGGVL